MTPQDLRQARANEAQRILGRGRAPQLGELCTIYQELIDTNWTPEPTPTEADLCVREIRAMGYEEGSNTAAAIRAGKWDTDVTHILMVQAYNAGRATAKPDAELVALLRECLSIWKFYGISQKLAARIDAALASQPERKEES